MDLHANAIQGTVSPKTNFDDFPAGFTGIDFFLDEIKDKTEICVVSPDAGAIKRAKIFH